MHPQAWQRVSFAIAFPPALKPIPFKLTHYRSHA
jgi:hypothetical protein